MSLGGMVSVSVRSTNIGKSTLGLQYHWTGNVGDRMARPRDLVPGNCHFLLNYFDSDLVIPSVQTLTFVGTDKDENGEAMWLFREPVAIAAEFDAVAAAAFE